MRRIEGEGTAYEEAFLYIVEVYYNNEDNSIIGWTEKESVYGESIEEIQQTLHWMMDALEKPILDEVELLQRAEEIRAMGGDTHDVGIPEPIDELFGRDPFIGDEELEDDGFSLWDQD